ncbi:MAG TPA: cyclic nucleotide-binding domain-containing protein [Paracoccaceae bacterium]|nr:cyclic nucleotide-binding domain-containing protein [Paracoccaceae bacterium]
MSLNDAVNVMMEVPMFRNVEPKRLRLFAFMGETLTYRAGERLFEKGDDGDAAYIIIDGTVDVLVPVEDGEFPVATLGAREIFGEMAVLCSRPRSTAIAARTDLTVLRLQRSAFLNLLCEFPEIALELIRILADRLEATTRELATTRAH